MLLERDVPCVPGLYFEKASIKWSQEDFENIDEVFEEVFLADEEVAGEEALGSASAVAASAADVSAARRTKARISITGTSSGLKTSRYEYGWRKSTDLMTRP